MDKKWIKINYISQIITAVHVSRSVNFVKLSKHSVNVGPSSETLAQRGNNTSQTSFVCWVRSWRRSSHWNCWWQVFKRYGMSCKFLGNSGKHKTPHRLCHPIEKNWNISLPSNGSQFFSSVESLWCWIVCLYFSSFEAGIAKAISSFRWWKKYLYFVEK